MEAYRENLRRYAVYYESNLVYHIKDFFFSRSVVFLHRQIPTNSASQSQKHYLWDFGEIMWDTFAA